jgi:hypothetical protein
MAWSKRTENGRVVATETITFADQQATDINTSFIDFIPKGADFTVIADPSTCLSAQADVAVWICATSGGTYSMILDDLIATIGAGLPESAIYDNSLKGDSPYFKLYVDPAGVQDADSVTLTVIV